MKPKCLLSLLTVIAATFQVAAIDLFHLKDFTVLPGDTALVEILLENETEYTAFQTDLYLPEGLTYVSQSVALTDRKSSDHMVMANALVDGGLRIISYSLGVNPFSGNSGALVTLKVVADDSLVIPAVMVQKRTRITEVTGVETSLEESSCVVTCPGDVNANGHTNIADVTALINYMLSGDPSTSAALANVNGDGQVNIADVTALINILLGG